MSGLEIAACVAGIVSAFNSGRELVRAIKKQRKKGREKRRAEELQNSLSVGAPAIQAEYDLDVARLGPRFNAGDGRGSILGKY